MARIEKAIEIHTSPEIIWPIACPDRVPQWMTLIKKVEYTSKKRDSVGSTAHWTGKACGIKSEWDTETTEWELNERRAWRSIAGNFTGVGSVTLISTKTGTKATFMMDYDLPYSVLGKTVDKLRVYKAVEKGTERGLKKLKEIAENHGEI
jgi:uncharacterized membrane protein